MADLGMTVSKFSNVDEIPLENASAPVVSLERVLSFSYRSCLSDAIFFSDAFLTLSLQVCFSM